MSLELLMKMGPIPPPSRLLPDASFYPRSADSLSYSVGLSVPKFPSTFILGYSLFRRPMRSNEPTNNQHFSGFPVF